MQNRRQLLLTAAKLIFNKHFKIKILSFDNEKIIYKNNSTS